MRSWRPWPTSTPMTAGRPTSKRGGLSGGASRRRSAPPRRRRGRSADGAHIAARDGHVDGGAVGSSTRSRPAVGPDGTLLVGLGARDDWAWVNERPQRQRPGLLARRGAVRLPRDTGRSRRRRARRGVPDPADTVVSDHPEGRFAASGALAESLLDDVPWDDYYGPGSPLERFVRAGGRVLRLGADLDTVTLIHYAEYLAPVPSKRRVRRHRLVTSREGAEIRVVRVPRRQRRDRRLAGRGLLRRHPARVPRDRQGVDRLRRPRHE